MSLPVERINKNSRPHCNGSYLTALNIIQANERDVLGGRILRFNEMSGRHIIGDELLRDAFIDEVRANIEARFDGAKGEKGLKLSREDVFHALVQVAETNRFHPVRSYLQGLKWDGIERLNNVAYDILDAKGELSQIVIRKFLISAVARPLSPGCKVDTVPILVGPQGVGKSSFIRTICAPWFIDSPIDVHTKDAFQVGRTAWLVELAELESLRRAKDATAIKAHITSAVDTYRASYGRFVQDVPRTYLFIGSTNQDEFLVDETGNRRFWPVRVGKIEIGFAEEQRDQIWAEAVHAFSQGERWWLSTEEESLLDTAHEQHRIRDAWEVPILAWANSQLGPFTTADVLAKAVEKAVGQWTRQDEMRVSAVLKANSWVRKTDRGASEARGKSSKTWRKVET